MSDTARSGVRVVDSVFEGNKGSTNGGCINMIQNEPDSSQPTSLWIEGCTFNDNSAVGGGAINVVTLADGQEETAKLSISSTTFAGNRASNGHGGAIAASGDVRMAAWRRAGCSRCCSRRPKSCSPT